MTTETPPNNALVIRLTAMPADANPYVDIFGGWLMSQMNLAAGSVASRHSGGGAVPITVEAMQFHRPVAVGDEISVYARLAKVGLTSMVIELEAWRRLRHGALQCQVTQGRFTFVAIDEERNPRPVAPLQAAAGP